MAQPNLGDAGVRFADQHPPGIPPQAGYLVVAQAGIVLFQAVTIARTYQEYFRERGHIPLPNRIGGYLAGYCFADGGGGY